MTTERQPLHPALVEAIELERESLNQRFKFAARQHRIDPQAFLEHMTERVNPIIAAVHAVFPERLRIVTSELFNVSLDLFAASLLSADAELPILDRLWRELLPKIPQFIARDPHRVTGSLCNAVLQIYRQTASGAEDWLNRMGEMAPRCSSPQQMLDAGKVLSWTCGMAQYRIAALQSARQLDHELLVRIFALPESITSEQMTGLLDRWEQNPWQAPSADSPTSNAVIQVATVGAFRGFGGAFLSPPTVAFEEGNLIVDDFRSIWQLYADRFGSYFHRVGDSHGRKRVAKAKRTDPVRIAGDGTVSWNSRSFQFSHLASATSAAFNGVTFAVTIPNSFHVFLLAEHA